jgi:flagellar biosynthesis anti-sigma factor FlgM
MKIEANIPATSQPAVERSTSQVAKTATPITQGTTEDRITLHSDSSSVQALASQALNSPEIRQPKVDALRESVSTEQYQYNSARTASAIVGHDVR